MTGHNCQPPAVTWHTVENFRLSQDLSRPLLLGQIRFCWLAYCKHISVRYKPNLNQIYAYSISEDTCKAVSQSSISMEKKLSDILYALLLFKIDKKKHEF